MRIIGAGLGRTGTTSVALALEELGLPCHNMKALIKGDGTLQAWGAILRDDVPPDWDGLLGGFEATIAWPTCFYYSELMERYPAAHVLLTTRDSESWYKSLRTSWAVLSGMRPFRFIPRVRGLLSVVEPTIQRICGETLDRERAIGFFEAHNAGVRATVPPARLIDYQVGQGWDPICSALGFEVPDRPFPRENSGDGTLKKLTRGLITGQDISKM